MFNAVLGVRYEETDMTSCGLEKPATAVVWVGGNEFAYEKIPGLHPIAQERRERQRLLVAEPRRGPGGRAEDVIARFSYSRSLARPPIGALGSEAGIFRRQPERSQPQGQFRQPGPAALSCPTTWTCRWSATTAPGSYASIGYFKKKVDNFLVSTTVQQTVERALLDPSHRR